MRGFATLWPALAIAYLLLACCFNPHIYFVDDDNLYQWMTKSMAEHGSMFIANGYQDIPSKLFVYMIFYVPTPGGLAAQYPPLLPVIGAPFFLLFGTHGLFVLNALAFVLSGALVFRITRRLFADETAAVSATLIYALFTFALPLSLTALPHTLATALILAAFWHALRAMDAKTLRLAALAGFWLGLAIGVRLDSAFALIGTLAPFIYARPVRWRGIAAFAGGMALPMLAIACINLHRFGSFNPFTYGAANDLISPLSHLRNFAPALFFLALFCGVPWLRPRIPERYGKPMLWLAATLALLGAALLSAATWAHFNVILWNADTITYDNGMYVRSLVQSCPWLGALPLVLWLAWRNRHGQALYVLSLIPVTYLLLIGAVGNPGGGGHVYVRYLTPALPFLSILVADAHRLLRPTPLAAVLAATIALALLVIFPDYAGLMHVPLALAAALAALSAACIAWNGKRMRQVWSGALMVVMAWSALMFAVVDYPLAYCLYPSLAATEAVSRALPANAFVFVSTQEIRHIAPLLDVPGIRIAMQPRMMRAGEVESDSNYHPPITTPAGNTEIRRVVKHFAQARAPIYTFFPHDPKAAPPLAQFGFHAEAVSPGLPGLLRWTK